MTLVAVAVPTAAMPGYPELVYGASFRMEECGANTTVSHNACLTEYRFRTRSSRCVEAVRGSPILTKRQ